ncbi:MAG: hypothetical protein ACW963_08100, partial [Candidatus Sifarchaeia archaeon]
MNLGFHIAVRALTIISCIVLPASVHGETGQAEESEARVEKRDVPIYVNPVQSIGPTVELSFPSGNLYMRFEQNFNILEMVF